MQEHQMKAWITQNCTDCTIDCILWQKEALLYPTRNRLMHTSFETCPKEKHKLNQVVIAITDTDDAEYIQQKHGGKP